MGAQQQEPRRRIGEILVESGFVSSKTLAQALAHQHGLEFVDLARVEVEPAATSLLPEQFARKAQVLPVRFLAQNLLQIAVTDPTNLRTADDLRLALGVNIRLAVADVSALEGTIERTYRVHIEIKQEGGAEEFSRLQDVLDSEGTATTIDLVNSMLSRAISEAACSLIEASTDELLAAAVEQGMKTLRQDGLRLCLAGVTSVEEIRRVVGDRLS